jgi:hypothetical protein
MGKAHIGENYSFFSLKINLKPEKPHKATYLEGILNYINEYLSALGLSQTVWGEMICNPQKTIFFNNFSSLRVIL